MRQRLALLGATGSIGRSCLEVLRHHPERFELVAVGALGSRLTELAAIVAERAEGIRRGEALERGTADAASPPQVADVAE